MSTADIGIKLRLDGAGQAASGLNRVASGMDGVKVSAAQTAAAMRMIPAQMTDIFTGLATGQSPFTVLLQQGGQLKDMFGSVGEAAKGVGRYMAGMVNPTTLAAAAVGAIGYAWYKGSKEADAYREALLLTGNAAGTSAAQLSDMARAMSVAGGTQSDAAAALARLAGSGKVAESSMAGLATSMLAVEKAFGISQDTFTKTLVALAEEPAKASAKLNEQYNYLTTTIYTQIKALEEQGRQEEAAALAQKTYADALGQRARSVVENLGYMERGWRGVSDAAKGAWDSMLSVGRQGTMTDRLTGLQQRLQEFESKPRGKWTTEDMAEVTRFGGEQKYKDWLRGQVAGISELMEGQRKSAALEGERAAAQRAGIAASERIDQLNTKALSKQEQLNKALKEYRSDLDKLRASGMTAATDPRLDPKNIAKTEAFLRDQYKEKGSAPRSYTDDAGTRMLASLREKEVSLRLTLVSEDKVTGALREQAEFEQKIADLKGKKQLTAEQKSLLASEDKIRAQIAINVGIEREIALKEKTLKQEQERAQALENTEKKADGIRRSMSDALSSQREQYDERLSVVGMGSRAAEELRSRQLIERQYSRFQFQLTEEAAKNGTLMSESYRTGVADIQSSLQQALQANQDYYDRVQELRGRADVGISQAVANYRDSAVNVMEMTQATVTHAFQGMEDAMVQFVTTGKLSFTSLANSIVADITRIIIKQQISNALGMAGSGGGAAGLIGAAIGLMSGTGGQAAVASSMGGDSLDNMLSLTNNFAGRASGGPVSAGGLYEVNEQGPELLSVSGRQFLMMGAQGGNVTPNHQLRGGGGSTVINVTVPMPAGANRATALQFGRDVAKQLSISSARNG